MNGAMNGRVFRLILDREVRLAPRESLDIFEQHFLGAKERYASASNRGELSQSP